ncbi:LacI family DNA-binding transcriptional regulator [Catenovulum sediminis]|uniref:LacI family DNA-binding transcriptional regulator n=1 Tax=Catenovulum sediminis TaxID=1740262 RepID=A0ABV1RIM6_9ALTE|nr:LacI family DNA-binding transcriptional regulator [Catenovulum sediminis]
MPTIKEVSEHAGVSQATVSRVMNGTAKVVEETRVKVLNAMKELGYRPNAHAQSLASNRSNSIGLLISEFDGPFYGALMAGAEEIFRKHKKRILISAGHGDEKLEKEAVEFLLGCRCDALVLHAETLSDEYLIEQANQGTHVILINRNIAEMEGQCLYIDNEQGSFMATEYLIEKGHKNIAYIAGPQWKHDARERFWGYQKALGKHNISLQLGLVEEGNFRESGGYQAASKLLDSGHKFTAVVCGNDQTAYGAISAIEERGLKVPDDISIVGFDDLPYSSLIKPKLTTVHFPIRQIAAEAARRILQDVYKEKNTHTFNSCVQASMVERNSVKSIT